MGFSLETSVPALTVFVQGLLSFFSPCVLPLIPLYVGYLAGGAGVEGDDGTIAYPRKKVLVNTLFFVVGVSFAFFLLGFGFTALGQFFTGNQRVFSVAASSWRRSPCTCWEPSARRASSRLSAVCRSTWGASP